MQQAAADSDAHFARHSLAVRTGCALVCEVYFNKVNTCFVIIRQFITFAGDCLS